MISLSSFTIFALAFVHASPRNVLHDEQWNMWKQTHQKRYSAIEEHSRRAIWETNLQFIETHNREADLGLHSYWVEMNRYGDLTAEEFARTLNGFRGADSSDKTRKHSMFVSTPITTLPPSIDWRNQGDVVPVKDQGQCGSCWAFSAVGSIESAYAIKTGKLVSLSEQQLIDCSGSFGNMGCNGGMMDQAFQYIIAVGGIEAADSYPYDASSHICIFNTSGVVVKLCGFIHIASGNESALQEAVATIGPTSVAIDASRSSFQLYKRGVYNEPRCSSTQLDHGVLVIGYGTESNQDYWLVQNSWGTSWGDQGYVKMSRNRNNQCGIATMASYPILC